MNSSYSLPHLRNRIANVWSRTSDDDLATAYAGEAGATHRMLVSRLLVERPEIPDEINFARKIAGTLPVNISDAGGFRSLLIAMLYNRAYDLAHQYNPALLPEWLLEDYLKYMCNPALLFCDAGETERYVEHMKQWVGFLHSAILGEPDSRIWQQVATLFVRHADFGPLYFNDANLRALYIKRSAIIRSVLQAHRYPVDYTFPEQASLNNPVRVGVLALHFEPHPESFAALPFYEHLPPGFDVTLYAMQRTNGELEKYCASRTSGLKILPENLADQVRFIREDNLDVLFISTNVTAACNPITLLATHRLARAQIAGTGSVTTTGTGNVDYYLSGRLTDTEGNSEHYSETLLWLDGPAHCFSYGAEQPRNSGLELSRSSLGIGADATVYASGANMFKILPELMTAWARIISAVPGSILMLYPYGPNWASSYPKDIFSLRIARWFSQYGVSSDRLVILDPDPVPSRHDIREYLKLADVYLDSFPFSGTTSLIEPLEVNLPIVTQQGNSFRTAEGAAMLRAINMESSITNGSSQYIELAVQLGADYSLRDETRKHIADEMQRGPSFLNSAAFSMEVSKLLKTIVHGH